MDCALNYALSASTLVLLLLTAPRLLSASFLWLSFVAFQLILCLFITSCFGISVIWNAALGSSVVFALRTRDPIRRALHIEFTVFVLSLCVAVDVYYALTAAALTTIAHIAAVVLGVLVAQIASSSFTSLVVDRTMSTLKNQRQRRRRRRRSRSRSRTTTTDEDEEQTMTSAAAALQNGDKSNES
jgi:hypothetical protein